MVLPPPWVSDVLGATSILCWLFAQVPQILENWRNRSVEGIALPFLICWLSGDLTNLVGCLLTDQLPFQTWLASYFICVDLVLLGQFGYYTRSNTRLQTSLSSSIESTRPMRHYWTYPRARSHSLGRDRAPGLEDSICSEPSWDTRYRAKAVRVTHADQDRGRPMTRSVPSLAEETSLTRTGTTGPPRTVRTSSVVFLSLWAFVGFVHFSSRSKSVSMPSNVWVVESTPRLGPRQYFPTEYDATTLDSVPPIDYQRLVGRVSSWTCSALYLLSRLPQVWKNFRRKSVEGLSIMLFCMAFLGNLLYTSSILLNPFVESDDTYLTESLPYIIGSAGTLCFDCTIVIQSLLYPRSHCQQIKHTYSIVEDEESLTPTRRRGRSLSLGNNFTSDHSHSPRGPQRVSLELHEPQTILEEFESASPVSTSMLASVHHRSATTGHMVGD